MPAIAEFCVRVRVKWCLRSVDYASLVLVRVSLRRNFMRCPDVTIAADTSMAEQSLLASPQAVYGRTVDYFGERPYYVVG